MTGILCNNKRVNPVYVYQSCMITAGLSAFMLPFTTKHWSLIVFSVIYGLSDDVFVTSECFILLTVVDSKRTTAAFCINNVFYSLSAAAGRPIAGELIILLQTEREICPGGEEAWGLDRKYSRLWSAVCSPQKRPSWLTLPIWPRTITLYELHKTWRSWLRDDLVTEIWPITVDVVTVRYNKAMSLLHLRPPPPPFYPLFHSMLLWSA